MKNPATGKFDKNLNPKAIEFQPSHRINPHVTLPQPHCPYIPYHPCIYSCASCSPPAPFPVPTRAVLLISVPGDATESTVRREFGAFGEVRRVQMERLHEGMVTLHFYDSRHAEAAVARTGLMGTGEAARGIRALYAAASSPEEALEEQGILAILGLHDGISPNKLKETFEVIGPVKEVRKGPVEGPWFAEFFDVRDAATALSQLNPNESVGAASRKPLLRSSPWKGGESSHEERRSLTIEDAEEESELKDTRTTLMIKNIPNKYSRSLLTRTLDDHCVKYNKKINDEGQPLSSFDFLYLPIDFNNKCNVGYGFINMTTPQAAWRLYKAFHLQRWELVNSRKICQVTYARLQGLEALKGHFQNWKLGGMKEEYLPVMFSPPRDGKLLTEPRPVTVLDGSH